MNAMGRADLFRRKNKTRDGRAPKTAMAAISEPNAVRIHRDRPGSPRETAAASQPRRQARRTIAAARHARPQAAPTAVLRAATGSRIAGPTALHRAAIVATAHPGAAALSWTGPIPVFSQRRFRTAADVAQAAAGPIPIPAVVHAPPVPEQIVPARSRVATERITLADRDPDPPVPAHARVAMEPITRGVRDREPPVPAHARVAMEPITRGVREPAQAVPAHARVAMEPITRGVREPAQAVPVIIHADREPVPAVPAPTITVQAGTTLAIAMIAAARNTPSGATHSTVPTTAAIFAGSGI